MDEWIKEINANFLTQVGLTIVRLTDVEQPSQASECLSKTRSVAGTEIQEIVSSVIFDLELYHRDFVFLLQDSIDRYISFNQMWPTTLLLSFNSVVEMSVILDQMESNVVNFYREMFEVQIEEILIEMGHFRNLVDETTRRSFLALSNVTNEMGKMLMSC